MTTLRTYQKPEQAYIDAGYLCSMGIDAIVNQDPAFGGVLFGVVESPYRLEVPDTQIEEASALLGRRPVDVPAPTVVPDAPVDSIWLHRFFRFILIYDAGCYVVFPIFGRLFNPETPPMVSAFLESLAFSDSLWRLAYVSYWPLVILGLISTVLCYFYLSIGRTLFALTIVWSMVTSLGPPPSIFNPLYGFFGGIQAILAGVALALMHWSPIRERFASGSKA